MIANGGSINCLGKWHGIKLTIGDYFLDSSMIEIQIGGANVVLDVQ
jgi:hypothetical protein